MAWSLIMLPMVALYRDTDPGDRLALDLAQVEQ